MLNWWLFKQKDKLIHFIAGIMMSQVLVIFLSLFTNSIILPILVSIFVSSATAYGKEVLYDKALGLGSYEIKDFLATEIGIGYGAIISLLFLIL